MAIAPLTIDEAREVLRVEIGLHFSSEPANIRYADVEGAIAALLVKYAHSGAADGEAEAERNMRGVFQLIGSARVNLESAKAMMHLQLHGREAFMGHQVDWEEAIAHVIRDAEKDLSLAQAEDNTVPF